jgi:hypothetical protein
MAANERIGFSDFWAFLRLVFFMILGGMIAFSFSHPKGGNNARFRKWFARVPLI